MYNAPTADQLNIIAHKLMILVGTTMCIFGIVGNILNICVFTTWSRFCKKSNTSKQTNRTNNCPLFLLVSSFANLIVIIYPLLTRIMFDGYQYKITENNAFIFCKFRYYVLHTCDLISLTCICMATFDRYLISSRKVHLRELSTTKQRTILIILFIICLIALHNIPIAVYYDVSKTGQCVLYSTIYSYYYLYTFQISLHGIIPIVFLSVFGLLTWKQLKTISENNPYNTLNSDKQLSRMLLLMSLAVILSSIPNCIENIYEIIFHDNNHQHSSRFFLYHVICSILFYTNPVTSFYIFYISTPNFRIQVQNLFQRNRNEIYSAHEQIQTKKTLITQN